MRTGSTPAESSTILCIWAVSGMARGCGVGCCDQANGAGAASFSAARVYPRRSRCQVRNAADGKPAGPQNRQVAWPSFHTTGRRPVDKWTAAPRLTTSPQAQQQQALKSVRTKNPSTTSPPKSRALNERIRAGLDGHQHMSASSSSVARIARSRKRNLPGLTPPPLVRSESDLTWRAPPRGPRPVPVLSFSTSPPCLPACGSARRPLDAATRAVARWLACFRGRPSAARLVRHYAARSRRPRRPVKCGTNIYSIVI